MYTSNQQFPTSSFYTIKIAIPSDLPNIIKLMQNNFHFEETVFNSLSSNAVLTQDERKIIVRILDDSVRMTFNSSPCLVAIHNETNKIIGVNLMTIIKNPKFKTSSDNTNYFTSNTNSQLVNQYFQYLSEFNEKADLFNKYPDAKTIVEFYAIAIDKNYRKMGISSNLMIAGITLAQNIKNISLVFGVFTSLYSMKSAEKIGMNTLLKINLLDYKNNTNELIFQNTKPHDNVYIMIFKL